MTDNESQREPLIVCNLNASVSIDELHTVKAALSGAGFVLEEHLADGRLEIHRAGPDDSLELLDTYQDHITDEIEEQINTAIKSFKKKLDRLADQAIDKDSISGHSEDEDTGIAKDDIRETILDASGDGEPDTSQDSATEDVDEDPEPDEAVEPEPDEHGESDEDETDSATETTYTCSNCGQEFDAPVKTQPEYHDCPGGDTGEEGATWTTENVLTVMEGNSWMTTHEIAQEVTGQSDPSYAVREKFHKQRHNHPGLDDQLESRRDPDDGRRKQYRLTSTSAESDNADDETEDDALEVHPDYVADCPDCDYCEEFQDTDEADTALDTHIAEEHSGDAESDAEADQGNRQGTHQPETVKSA